MRVGSGSDSIYQLLLSRSKTGTTPAGEGQQPPAPPIRSVGGSVSDSSIAAAFQARLAQSSFDRSDTDGDGFVDKVEYVSSNMKPRSDGYVPDQADVERTWSELDKTGKGHLSQDEFKQGFSSVLNVSVGTFGKPIR
ncbi:EF-hand domain-containing protein [Agrobacterium tumefaciens]|uniref:EF-hand domain-containing protein n=1 Tax=Agrobacterium tumefaciens TaxID=358 RepID=UPI003BA057B0